MYCNITALTSCSVARYRQFSWRGAGYDDGRMLLVVAAYTRMIFGINVLIDRGAEASYLWLDKLASMLKAEIDLRVGNSKWMYTILHLQLITLWLAKTCMIMVYLRFI
jgi:hypothetical protein